MAGSDQDGSGAAADTAEPGGDAPPVMRERRRRRDHIDLPFAATLMLGVAGGLLLANFVGGLLSRLSTLIVIVIVSLFLSFAMEPAVQWLAERGIRRGMGTFLVFLAAGLLLVGFIAVMAQLIIDQVSSLIDNTPSLLQGLSDQAERLPGDLGDAVSEWLREQRTELPRRIPQFADTLGRGVIGVGETLAGGLFQLLTTLLVTFYLVADGPRLRRTLVARVRPDRQKEFLEIWELAISKTGGYVYSRVLTAIVSAVVHTIAFMLLDIQYATALGIWVGIISSLIPVVGTYLAGALPLIVALPTSVLAAVGVLVTVVVYQQIENYLIAPRITSATMSLHPAVAFLSVLAGAALLGAAGALLALPAAAVVAGLVSAVGERHEVMEHGLTKDEDPKAFRLGRT
ncbi:MAG: AI-2E family transporter [Nitriliruptorales bacterium]|nr:AI-2E family transporter [Nitriliruptorales bacterium]